MSNFSSSTKLHKIDGDLLVTGDFTVTGTTLTFESTVFETADNNITLNKGGTAATATGGGITIEMSDATDVTLEYISDTLLTNISFGVGATKDYQVGGASVLNATTLGSGVVSSSLTSLGTLASLVVSGGSSIDGPIDFSNTNTSDVYAIRMVDKGINLNAQDITNGGTITATTFSGDLSGDVTGTIITATQANITSLGTLTSLSVSGDISTDTLTIASSFTVGDFEVTDGINSTFTNMTLDYSNLYDDVKAAVIANGGTGYTASDVLTVQGGTGTAATLTVTSETAGEIDGIEITTGGTYTAPPANPVSVTGGTGSGATFNLTIPLRSLELSFTEMPDTSNVNKKTSIRQAGQIWSISSIDVDDTGTEDFTTSSLLISINLTSSDITIGTDAADVILGRVGHVWPITDGTSDQVMVTDGSGTLSFKSVGTIGGGILLSSNNLSDLDNAGTARTNLGLGDMAVESTTDYYTKTAADTAFLDAASNLSDLTNVPNARTSLGLGSIAVETATDYYTKTAADTAFLDAASNLSDLANTGTARTNLGLGTMAVETATEYYTKTAADTAFLDAASNLSDLANVTTARTNLGLSSMALETASSYSTTIVADATYLAQASNLSDIVSVVSARTNLGITATGSDTTYLYRTSNLSDLANATVARTNLGLGDMAVASTTDYYTKTAADTAFLDAASNLSDLANAGTARTNLGITATGADTTYAYRANNLSDLANAGTARTNLGLGDMAVASTTDYYTKTAADTAFLDAASNLSDLANVATARTNLGITATGTDTTYAYRANNLSDLTDAGTARTNIGLGTGDSPVFQGLALTVASGNISMIQTTTDTAGFSIHEMVVYPATLGRKIVTSTNASSHKIEAVEIDSSGTPTATPVDEYLSIDTSGNSLTLGLDATALNLGALSYPVSDGNNYEVLTTDGAGTISFVNTNLSIHRELRDLIATAVTAAAVVDGGNGYTDNDVLTIVGSGDKMNPAGTLIVTGVSTGTITSVSVAQGGSYVAEPSNPITVTGGTGSGATFNLTFSARLLTADLDNRKVGLGQSTPLEKLHLDGAIVVGDAVSGTPVSGTIKYDGTDFQGYDGNTAQWKSLTTYGSQAWTSTVETFTSTSQAINTTSYTEVTAMSRSITLANIENTIRVEVYLDFEMVNASGTNANFVIKRCEGAQSFATGTVVREFSIPYDADIDSKTFSTLDISGNTSTTYKVGIKVANATDTVTTNPAGTHPGPSVLMVSEYQPVALQLINVSNLGAGVNIYESTVSGVARLRSLTNTDGHMTITQGSTEINIGIDTIDGGSY